MSKQADKDENAVSGQPENGNTEGDNVVDVLSQWRKANRKPQRAILMNSVRDKKLDDFWEEVDNLDFAKNVPKIDELNTRKQISDLSSSSGALNSQAGKNLENVQGPSAGVNLSIEDEVYSDTDTNWSFLNPERANPPVRRLPDPDETIFDPPIQFRISMIERSLSPVSENEGFINPLPNDNGLPFICAAFMNDAKKSIETRNNERSNRIIHDPNLYAVDTDDDEVQILENAEPSPLLPVEADSVNDNIVVAESGKNQPEVEIITENSEHAQSNDDEPVHDHVEEQADDDHSNSKSTKKAARKESKKKDEPVLIERRVTRSMMKNLTTTTATSDNVVKKTGRAKKLEKQPKKVIQEKSSNEQDDEDVEPVVGRRITRSMQQKLDEELKKTSNRGKATKRTAEKEVVVKTKRGRPTAESKKNKKAVLVEDTTNESIRNVQNSPEKLKKNAKETVDIGTQSDNITTARRSRRNSREDMFSDDDHLEQMREPIDPSEYGPVEHFRYAYIRRMTQTTQTDPTEEFPELESLQADPNTTMSTFYNVSPLLPDRNPYSFNPFFDDFDYRTPSVLQRAEPYVLHIAEPHFLQRAEPHVPQRAEPHVLQRAEPHVLERAEPPKPVNQRERRLKRAKPVTIEILPDVMYITDQSSKRIKIERDEIEVIDVEAEYERKCEIESHRTRDFGCSPIPELHQYSPLARANNREKEKTIAEEQATMEPPAQMLNAETLDDRNESPEQESTDTLKKNNQETMNKDCSAPTNEATFDLFGNSFVDRSDWGDRILSSNKQQNVHDQEKIANVSSNISESKQEEQSQDNSQFVSTALCAEDKPGDSMTATKIINTTSRTNDTTRAENASCQSIHESLTESTPPINEVIRQDEQENIVENTAQNASHDDSSGSECDLSFLKRSVNDMDIDSSGELDQQKNKDRGKKNSFDQDFWKQLIRSNRKKCRFHMSMIQEEDEPTYISMGRTEDDLTMTSLLRSSMLLSTTVQNETATSADGSKRRSGILSEFFQNYTDRNNQISHPPEKDQVFRPNITNANQNEIWSLKKNSTSKPIQNPYFISPILNSTFTTDISRRRSSMMACELEKTLNEGCSENTSKVSLGNRTQTIDRTMIQSDSHIGKQNDNSKDLTNISGQLRETFTVSPVLNNTILIDTTKREIEAVSQNVSVAQENEGSTHGIDPSKGSYECDNDETVLKEMPKCEIMDPSPILNNTIVVDKTQSKKNALMSRLDECSVNDSACPSNTAMIQDETNRNRTFEVNKSEVPSKKIQQKSSEFQRNCMISPIHNNTYTLDETKQNEEKGEADIKNSEKHKTPFRPRILRRSGNKSKNGTDRFIGKITECLSASTVKKVETNRPVVEPMSVKRKLSFDADSSNDSNGGFAAEYNNPEPSIIVLDDSSDDDSDDPKQKLTPVKRTPKRESTSPLEYGTPKKARKSIVWSAKLERYKKLGRNSPRESLKKTPQKSILSTPRHERHFLDKLNLVKKELSEMKHMFKP